MSLKKLIFAGGANGLKKQNCLKLCKFREHYSAGTGHFEKLTCMCFATRVKMLTERVRTLEESLKIM